MKSAGCMASGLEMWQGYTDAAEILLDRGCLFFISNCRKVLRSAERCFCPMIPMAVQEMQRAQRAGSEYLAQKPGAECG